MILTCPQCGTQYVVKDDAIPPGGRQVRCASCKHSWHQDPEAEIVEEAAGKAVETPTEPGDALQSDVPAEAEFKEAPASDPDDSVLQQQNWDDLPPPVWPEQKDDGAEDKVPVPPSGEDTDAGDKLRGEWFPESDDEFGPFSTRDETGEGARRSPLLKVLVTVLVVVAIAVAFWFLAPPELKSRLGVAQAEREELQLTLTYQERQKLASGNELFVVTGRVINPTGETKPVPPIEAQIRTANGEVVYSWTIPAPASSIPPGGRAPFNSQETGVPVRDGQLLTIAFAAPAKNA